MLPGWDSTRCVVTDTGGRDGYVVFQYPLIRFVRNFYLRYLIFFVDEGYKKMRRHYAYFYGSDELVQGIDAVDLHPWNYSHTADFDTR